MAITVGTTAEIAGSPSHTVTVDSGSNRVFVAMTMQSRSPPNVSNNATLGGVSPDGYFVYQTGVNSSVNLRIAGYYWLDAALTTIGSGSKTLTWTGTDTTQRSGYINAAGVAQSAPEATYYTDESASASSHTTSLTGVSSGALVVMGLISTATSGVTSYTDGTGIITLSNRAGLSYRTDGTSLTMGTTFLKMLHAGASFAPAATGPAPILLKWQL